MEGGGDLLPGTREFEVLLNKFHLYCISLSEMIEMSEKYIKAMRELASLKTVRQHLTRQNSTASTERYAVMEDNVPDELKCPVCFEIFEGEVLQCRNGHSVCFHCCETLRECPECRVEYGGGGRNGGGKVRNRTVEKLMLSLKIDCPYSPSGCKFRMPCKEMQEHAEECEFMNKPVRSPEYLEVKRNMKKASGEVKRLEKKLGETNKQLVIFLETVIFSF